MIITCQFRPFHSPAERAGRLYLFGAMVLGFTLLTFWNPVTHPGPKLCLMRHAFGLPCPLCGMTRGVSLCLHGQPVEATRFHLLAIPCVLLGIVLASKWAIEFLRNQRLEIVLRRPVRKALWTALTLIVLACWAYAVVYRREDNFSSTWVGSMLRLLWS
jgi:hypothetical protein